MPTDRGKWIKIVLGTAMLVGGGTAIVLELRPRTEDRAISRAASPQPVHVSIDDNSKVTDVEDAALEKAMSRPERYVTVNGPHATLNRDPSGRVWFDVFRGDAAEFKRSVERAAHGQTRIIRSGHILLVDSVGRYWCKPTSGGQTLLCYDGKSWLAPHDIAKVVPPSSRGFFQEIAAEDSAGNCYFVSGSGQAVGLLHCYTTAGAWNEIPFPNNAHLQGEQVMSAQTNGRLAVYSGEKLPQGNGASPMLAKIMMAMQDQHQLNWVDNNTPAAAYIWDGQTFIAYSPPDRADQGKRVNQAVPLPDGSILTIYQGTDEVSLNWPPGTTSRLNAAAQKLITQLDDMSSSHRTAAYTALLKLGPQIRAKIDAAIADPANQSPQRQESLHTLAEQLKQAALPNQSADETLFGGRYELGNITQTSRSIDGSVRLFAMKCFDTDRQQELGPSFVTINSKGEWNVSTVPDNPDLAWLPAVVGEAYEDTHGLLWIDHGFAGNKSYIVVNPIDFSVRPALPPGLAVDDIVTSDRQGRIYCRRGDGWVVINPSSPEPQSDLPMRRVAARALVHLPGEPAAWAINDVPQRIGANGKLTPIPIRDDLPCHDIVPMRDGAAFINCKDKGASEEDVNYPFFWDGHRLRNAIGGTFRNEVEGRPADLMRAASLDFQPIKSMGRILRLASDRGHGIWCLAEEHDEGKFIVMASEFRYLLEYYDGNAWYDAWDVLKHDTPADANADAAPLSLERDIMAMGAVNGGHTVLVYSKPKDQFSALEFENGKLHRTPVPADAGLGLLLNEVTSSTGQAWFWSDPPRRGSANKTAARIVAYRDGKLVAIPWQGTPVLVDKKDRLWCIQPKKLSVLEDQKGKSVAVDDLDENARVIESTDGRLWLLHTSGIDQVMMTDAGPALERHWNFNMPLNRFDAFCDQADGVWLSGIGGEIGRIQLPSGN